MDNTSYFRFDDYKTYTYIYIYSFNHHMGNGWTENTQPKVQCLQICLHNGDDVMHKQMNTICKPKSIRLFAHIINHTIILKIPRFSRNVYAISDRIWCNKHPRHIITENVITMGKIDTFDLIMIIIWAIGISFQSPELKRASWTHTTPCIVMTTTGNQWN